VLGSITIRVTMPVNVFDRDGYSLEFVLKNWQHPQP